MVSWFSCAWGDSKAEEQDIAAMVGSSMWFDLPQMMYDPRASKECVAKEGEFKELPNGMRYAGQWNGAKRHGRGVLLRPDGAKYIGQFEEDRATGSGKFVHTNGDTYEE